MELTFNLKKESEVEMFTATVAGLQRSSASFDVIQDHNNRNLVSIIIK